MPGTRETRAAPSFHPHPTPQYPVMTKAYAQTGPSEVADASTGFALFGAAVAAGAIALAGIIYFATSGARRGRRFLGGFWI
jgi:hypothetical protein